MGILLENLSTIQEYPFSSGDEDDTSFCPHTEESDIVKFQVMRIHDSLG